MAFPVKKGHCASVFGRDIRGAFKAEAGWHQQLMGPPRCPAPPTASPAFLALPRETQWWGWWQLGQEVPWPLPCHACVEPGPTHWPGTPGMGVQGGLSQVMACSEKCLLLGASPNLGLGCVLGACVSWLGEGWAAPTPVPPEGQHDGPTQTGASDALY